MPGWMPVGRRQRGPATRARVGQAPINARKASPTGPCCASAGRPGADKRPKGVSDRTGAGERATNSTTTLVVDEAKHPIGDHQPVLIWRNALDQVESSLTGRMPPNGLNTPDRVHSFRWCAYCPRRCGAGVRAQASSLDDARDRAATNTLCPMNLQARRMAPSHHATPDIRQRHNLNPNDTRPRPVSRPRPRQ